jgi:hypothetical protein
VTMMSCINNNLCHFYFNNAILSKNQIETPNLRN